MSKPLNQDRPRSFVFLRRFFIRLTIIAVCVGVVSILAGYLFAVQIRQQPGPHDKEVLVYIEPDAGMFQIKYELSRAGIISHPFHFQLAAGLTRKSIVPKAGEYLIPAAASIDDILSLLHSGKVYQRRVTIIEGWRGYEVMKQLNETPFMHAVITAPPAEGSVFPDTYFYTKGTDRRDLLARMQGKMDIILAEIWSERQEGLPYENPNAMLILASIIEKETGRTGERGVVASVFINRLRRNMRLQSDPTVSYGLALSKPLPTKLTKADLKKKHGWNTYKIKGLPKTPIANPGLDALTAAAFPEKSDYLYFVADGKGGHNFAKTLDTHNINVRNYRRLIKQKEQNQ